MRSPRFAVAASAVGIAAAVVALVASTAISRSPETGLASFYDEDFEGRETASGERFDPDELTAAHPSLAPGTIVEVTNLENGKSVRVRVTDRGPAASARRDGVVIDLSEEAAERLAFIDRGRARVTVAVQKEGDDESD